MVNSGLQIKEQAYQSASRAFEYFVTGLASVLFLATAFSLEAGQPPLASALDVAAVILFVVSIVAGLKKLEYSVAILGADYTVGLTEADQTSLTVRESNAVLRDLNETIEQLSDRASFVYRLRNWSLLLGLVMLITSRFF
jgi:hypothetical protein